MLDHSIKKDNLCRYSYCAFGGKYVNESFLTTACLKQCFTAFHFGDLQVNIIISKNQAKHTLYYVHTHNH